MSPEEKAILLAREIREEALRCDPISLDYDEVKGILNAQELDDIANGIASAIQRRNEAEMLILELLHVLASPNPHSSLVEETLRDNSNIFDRGRAFLGVEMSVAGTMGAYNG